jgi:hypothetical protein
MGWFDHYLGSRWFDFPVAREHLVRGPNEIVMRKLEGPADAQDGVKVGIDAFMDQGNSRASFDGGETWQTGPLYRILKRVGYPNYGHRGELMVRFNLYEDAEDLGRRPPFSHDDLPPLPAIDLNPPIKALAAPGSQPATYRRGDVEDVFENGWMHLHLTHSDGLALERFVHKPMDADILTMERNPLFLLDIDGRSVSSRDLSVHERVEQSAGPGESKVMYILRDETSGMQVELSLRLGAGQELSAGLYLKSRSEETRLVKAAFPLLSGIGWSPGFQTTTTCFPIAPVQSRTVPPSSCPPTAAGPVRGELDAAHGVLFAVGGRRRLRLSPGPERRLQSASPDAHGRGRHRPGVLFPGDDS